MSALREKSWNDYRKEPPIDLSRFAEGTHWLGHDCLPVRTLRQLRASMTMPWMPRLEFWTHSTTNPAKVACGHCWNEVPEVQHAFAAVKRTRA